MHVFLDTGKFALTNMTYSPEMEALLAENERLKLELQQTKIKLAKVSNHEDHEEGKDVVPPEHLNKEPTLNNSDVYRYSRQLILPQVGVAGQIKLRQSSILVVGAGGLGAPALLYLAAAGVGTLGIVDYDAVELNNLHRQVIHTEQRIGMPKTDSAKLSVSRLNSSIHCIPFNVLLDGSNALEIIKDFDIVLDCTDNVATRYLLNDACVLLVKVLVSASALRLEGQLTTYHHQNGPCYRCLFPTPPPSHAVTNCNDGGVLGVVPGIMGCFQALEALKIACGLPPSYSGRMGLFDASTSSLRNVKLRPRQASCAVCGDQPTITQLIDYVEFCGASANDKAKKGLQLCTEDERMSCQEYKAQFIDAGVPHVLLDVRSPIHYAICRLSHSQNIPLSTLAKELESLDPSIPIVTVCRRGNDSQRAVKLLHSHGFTQVKDIIGGLTAWSAEVDPSFPTY